MADQDFLPDGGLGFEHCSTPAPGESSNPQSETSEAQESHQAESTISPSENLQSPELEDLDAYNLIEPPPLDWRSDSSSNAGSVGELESCSVGEFEVLGSFNTDLSENTISTVSDMAAQNPTEASDKTEELTAQELCENKPKTSDFQKQPERKEKQERKMLNEETEKETEVKRDLDHSHIQSLLTQLHLFHPSTPISTHYHPDDSANHSTSHDSYTPAEASAPSCQDSERSMSSALLFSQEYQKDLLQLLEDPEPEEPGTFPQLVHTPLLTPSTEPRSGFRRQSSDADEMISISHSEDIWHRHLQDELLVSGIAEEDQWAASESVIPDQLAGENTDVQEVEAQPAYKNVPGPCDPEDLLDGVIFGAKYLGSTQLQSEKNPSTNARMAQAQEAVDRIKAPEGESQPMTEVDLFISTQRIKVLSADTQEAMMDHSLQMISYIADIGNILVLMARRKPAGRKTADSTGSSTSPPKKCWMICHLFSSDDAQIIAQAIGQAFGVAYQQFLYANGIKASDLRPGEYSDYLGTQELYNGDLVHFSCSENIKEVCISKKPGEILGVAIVESGWGSILPTVVVANLLHGGPAERSGELSIGDRIMSVNGTSLVGLPITTCQSIIRDLKSLAIVKLSIVHCPPVTMAIIKRPDPKYQLGFSVEDGIICSLMRGGIAERGGIRVGHRIIEINGQSVVATPHEKIIQILSNAVGEIHLKTMPTSTYRLLTGLDQPVFL
ncbi:amyloid-beta A4 precursor protein-binding family A member 3 isoform X1 [Triplophysa rosa]|uniref:amyloid-beta A4 precursor protein-binding family A member 3 isoform X1 n=1 Tax=Triplophysa rosa TaxID=992332 RepID=UPI00254638C0|nr:amyloid-beta A4 precursor protein-binding family A member 3 isoform X1 [Triplophysa rosa]XP_057217894.1 amyloid-beta A4 precursor protein-binding family A member 3 isoform X1 [Triplophysa rosa]